MEPRSTKDCLLQVWCHKYNIVLPCKFLCSTWLNKGNSFEWISYETCSGCANNEVFLCIICTKTRCKIILLIQKPLSVSFLSGKQVLLGYRVLAQMLVNNFILYFSFFGHWRGPCSVYLKFPCNTGKSNTTMSTVNIILCK